MRNRKDAVMKRARCSLAIVGLVLLGSSAPARAGWLIEWSTNATNSKGTSLSTATASQAIAGNRVRLEQPQVITLVDYNRDEYAILNPVKYTFWSGSTEDYVRDTRAAREAAVQQRMGNLKGTFDKQGKAATGDAKIDPSTLPPVSVSATGERATIAGYETTKYEVRVDGALFEEVWIAPIDLSADLDRSRYMAHQQKTAAGRSGRVARTALAVYRSPEYGALFDKGFALKTVSHHQAGRFERTATSVKQAEVDAATFAVPESYRKVRLGDLLEPPPTPAPAAPEAP
jgi:hypothetical protein